MKVENSTYYCTNTKGEMVGIPLVEIRAICKYYNEKELNQYIPANRWTFAYEIHIDIAKKNKLRYFAENVDGENVEILAAPVATEIEVANVWNSINDFHNRAYRDTVTRGRAEEFVI